MAAEEEREAINQEHKRYEGMEEDDFGFDDIEDEEEEKRIKAAEKKMKKKNKKKNKKRKASAADDLSLLKAMSGDLDNINVLNKEGVVR